MGRFCGCKVRTARLLKEAAEEMRELSQLEHEMWTVELSHMSTRLRVWISQQQGFEKRICDYPLSTLFCNERGPDGGRRQWLDLSQVRCSHSPNVWWEVGEYVINHSCIAGSVSHELTNKILFGEVKMEVNIVEGKNMWIETRKEMIRDYKTK